MQTGSAVACFKESVRYTVLVDRANTWFRRRWMWLALGILFMFCAVPLVQHSTWNKERYYHRLVSGSEQERSRAAAHLVQLRGQVQLIRALRSDSDAVHSLAERSLWELWFRDAGQEAYRLALTAQQFIHGEQYAEAKLILNYLTAQYPRYAEGWNRRATLFWLAGDYARSIADCRQVLALNPEHFGAWQGMGLCQIHLGDVQAGSRSLRKALKIHPHDATTRRLLEWIKDWQRGSPPETPRRKGNWV